MSNNIFNSHQHYRQIIVFILIFLLVSLACQSILITPPQEVTPPELLPTQKPTFPPFPNEFTSKIGDFRIYILGAQHTVFFQLGDQTYNPTEGFEFLIVDLVIENLSDQPLQMYYFEFVSKGDTSSGEYTYPQYRIYDTSYNGTIPPHFRVRRDVVFEVAKNISNLKLVIEARNQSNNFTSEITIPEPGIGHTIELPYSTENANLIAKKGEEFAWIQGINANIIDVVRAGSGLQVAVEINNQTGYSINTFGLFNEATIFDGSGMVYPSISREVDITSIPPAVSKVVRYYIDFALPENTENAILFLHSTSDTENLWVSYDISDTKQIWKMLFGINMGDDADIVSISWSPDSMRIAAAGSDDYHNGLVQIWNVTNGTLIQTWGEDMGAYSVAWSPNSSTIAVGSSGFINLYDANDFSRMKTIQANVNREEIYQLAWSPNNIQIVSSQAEYQNKPQIWDISINQVIKTFDYLQSHDAFNNIAWSPNGKFLAVSTYYGYELRMWETSNWEQYKIFDELDYSYTTSWSPDSKKLAIGGSTASCNSDPNCNLVISLNIETGEKHSFIVPMAVVDTTWINNGENLAIVAKEYDVCRVYIWDLSSEQALYTLPCINSWSRITSISWSPDGSKLGIGHNDGLIYIWQLLTQPSSSSDSLTAEPDKNITEITATTAPPTVQIEIGDTPTTQTFESGNNNWSGILSIRMPTLNEIRAEVPVSLWDANVLNVRDMLEPGIDDYSGEVQYGQEYLLPVYWCATTPDILSQNIDYINTVFMVNGEIVPDKYVLNYNYDTNTGWRCNYHTIIIGGWERNAEYTLDTKRTFLKDISDGQSNYSAGEYIYRLEVRVR